MQIPRNRNDFVYPFLFTEMKYLSKQAALAMILDILQFSHSVNGINFSGLGYSTSGVRVVLLTRNRSTDDVEPTAENALNGSYLLPFFSSI
jgi:hypothetical protein